MTTTRTGTPFLSKSKYLNGLQCKKLLWHYYNAKNEIPPASAATQAIFDQGHEVGAYAKKLYPNGIEVAEGIIDPQKVVDETKNLIAKRIPLFEAAFRYKDAFARADILNPVGSGAWEIVEVKSSTKVKPTYLHDLALQWYTFQGAGLEIKKCSILHLDNRYVRKGDMDPKQVFESEDVTVQVRKLLPNVEKNLEQMILTITMESFPPVPIGEHCKNPYECALYSKCFEFLPPNNPLTLIRLRKKKAFSLIHDGFTDILNFDASEKFSDQQKIQIASVRTRKEHIDKKGIQSFLHTLKYPLYYLDFETIGPAIPLFDHSRPFQHIPFQFSLHIQVSQGSTPEHVSYLAEGKEDPRPEFLRLLKLHLGDRGSIVAYNAFFEKSKLKSACDVFPEYGAWNKSIQKRWVDLLDPFKSFFYYHYEQSGSASIKAVLPALTGRGYEGMAIAEGGAASEAFLRVTYRGGVEESEREDVRKNLEEYCKLDTMAMVEIIERLRMIATRGDSQFAMEL